MLVRQALYCLSHAYDCIQHFKALDVRGLCVEMQPSSQSPH
jgi:hypothetical protein